MVDERRTNVTFARAILHYLTRNGCRCIVLDIDTLYSSNSDYILSPMSERQARAVEVLVPDPECDLEFDITNLVSSEPDKTIIIDSLNSMYHLLAARGQSYRGRKLAFIMACFSYLARAEKKAVIITMYRRENITRLDRGRQMSGLSDQLFLVDPGDQTLVLRCDRGDYSPHIFSLPIL
jgi:hypothetical protein